MDHSTLIENITSKVDKYKESNPAFRGLGQYLHEFGDFYLNGGAIRPFYRYLELDSLRASKQGKLASSEKNLTAASMILMLLFTLQLPAMSTLIVLQNHTNRIP